MTEPQEESPSTEFTKQPRGALMILGSPAASRAMGNGLRRCIVGVPWLLLNTLHLQKRGVDRITLYGAALTDSDRASLTEVLDDSRLRIPVEWVTDSQAVRSILSDPACRWIVHGSAVHDGRELIASQEPALTLTRQAALEHVEVLTGGSVSDWESLAEKNTGDASEHTLQLITGRPECRVLERRDFRRQQERLLKLSGVGNDSLMDRWVTRHLSRQFTRWLMLTPITPNQITILHMLVGLGAAGYFYVGEYALGVVGATLLILSLGLDCSDGEVARLKFQQSPFGGMLDIVADNVVHVAVFWAIGMGLYRSTDQVMYQYIGGLAVLGSLSCFLLLQAAVFDQRTGGKSLGMDSQLADQLANRDFIYFLWVMALLGQLKIFIVLTAVGSALFAGFIAYKKIKSSASGPTVQ